MLAIILFIIVCLFVFVVMPPKTENGVRPFSIEFIMFLLGAAFIYTALKTKIIEELTSVKFLQIIIKIILVIAGAGIIVLSYKIN